MTANQEFIYLLGINSESLKKVSNLFKFERLTNDDLLQLSKFQSDLEYNSFGYKLKQFILYRIKQTVMYYLKHRFYRLGRLHAIKQLFSQLIHSFNVDNDKVVNIRLKPIINTNTKPLENRDVTSIVSSFLNDNTDILKYSQLYHFDEQTREFKFESNYKSNLNRIHRLIFELTRDTKNIIINNIHANILREGRHLDINDITNELNNDKTFNVVLFDDVNKYPVCCYNGQTSKIMRLYILYQLSINGEITLYL
jgi:hypothetical protein